MTHLTKSNLEILIALNALMDPGPIRMEPQKCPIAFVHLDCTAKRSTWVKNMKIPTPQSALLVLRGVFAMDIEMK